MDLRRVVLLNEMTIKATINLRFTVLQGESPREAQHMDSLSTKSSTRKDQYVVIAFLSAFRDLAQLDDLIVWDSPVPLLSRASHTC